MVKANRTTTATAARRRAMEKAQRFQEVEALKLAAGEKFFAAAENQETIAAKFEAKIRKLCLEAAAAAGDAQHACDAAIRELLETGVTVSEAAERLDVATSVIRRARGADETKPDAPAAKQAGEDTDESDGAESDDEPASDTNTELAAAS